MLIGIEDGHKNLCLFETKSKNIYITHDCLFLDSGAFWPEYCSNCTSSSIVKKLNSIYLATVGSSKLSPPLAIAPDEVNVKSPHHFSDSEHFPTKQPLGVEQLPPEEVCLPNEAPNNIEGYVSGKSIITGKLQTQPSSRFIGSVRSGAPQSFKEAMVSPKANACMFEIKKEFSRLERHGFLEEVTKTNEIRLLRTTWLIRENTEAHRNLLEEKARL
ncbi:hypothetical protein O181_004532 [Austropuccinia psidii MF-1]|uniref:Uncharacterized protein n=1 Tax=Austropuccinia psidii MF-1 TaxID=1389203 RepID=A0A9Q3GFW0_9BASI|nr:hypothetical protein [Austropuccinia psidii MF-1]